MTEYNKLVRDNVPNLINAQGGKAETHKADDPEFLEKAREKLREEVDEFVVSNDPDELADILEITYAVAEAMGLNEKALDHLRDKKRDERGGFKHHIILERS